MTSYIFKTLCFLLIGLCHGAHADSGCICLKDQLNKQFNRFVRNTYGYECLGGGGEFMNDISHVSLQYNCYKNYTLEEIRPILLDLREHYVHDINSDANLRPYLHEYPFKSIGITLHCVDSKDGKWVDEPYIVAAQITQYGIKYFISPRINGQKSTWADFKIVHKETLQEATERAEASIKDNPANETIDARMGISACPTAHDESVDRKPKGPSKPSKCNKFDNPNNLKTLKLQFEEIIERRMNQ